MHATLKRIVVVTSALLALSAHASTTKPSLYARLGGEPVMSAVVSEYVDELSSDPKTKASFRGTDLSRVKRLLVEQICDITGGGCHYSGDSMREVHEGHHISQAQFFDAVAMLRKDLRRHHVPLHERNELLVLLAPMSHDIIEVPSPPRPTSPTPAH